MQRLKHLKTARAAKLAKQMHGAAQEAAQVIPELGEEFRCFMNMLKEARKVKPKINKCVVRVEGHLGVQITYHHPSSGSGIGAFLWSATKGRGTRNTARQAVWCVSVFRVNASDRPPFVCVVCLPLQPAMGSSSNLHFGEARCIAVCSPVGVSQSCSEARCWRSLSFSSLNTTLVHIRK